ncbi:hypothetical protein EOM39_05710 [Candidatus Gracilibacteria bacterium]|nr:hypothetical protein [Candidatus Gracilibacteria bacterium]
MREFIISIVIIIILIGIYLIFFYKGQKKIPKNKIDYYKNIVLKTQNSQISSKEKIVTYDKIYHNILKETGYEGNFGEILKKKPSVIKDINKIWELHKLRNVLVHEIESSEEKKLISQGNSYKDEILKLLKGLS